jgi:hypothetical protein
MVANTARVLFKLLYKNQEKVLDQEAAEFRNELDRREKTTI